MTLTSALIANTRTNLHFIHKMDLYLLIISLCLSTIHLLKRFVSKAVYHHFKFLTVVSIRFLLIFSVGYIMNLWSKREICWCFINKFMHSAVLLTCLFLDVKATSQRRRLVRCAPAANEKSRKRFIGRDLKCQL